MKNGKNLTGFVTLQTNHEGFYLGPPMASNYCKPLETLNVIYDASGSAYEFPFHKGQVYLCGSLSAGSPTVAVYPNGPGSLPRFFPVEKLSFLADGSILPEPPFLPGDEVYYVPPHAENFLHADAQAGTVRKVQLNSTGSYSVWVSYHSGDTAALTPLKSLQKR